jgi:hypothetical protein
MTWGWIALAALLICAIAVVIVLWWAHGHAPIFPDDYEDGRMPMERRPRLVDKLADQQRNRSQRRQRRGA